MLAVRRAAEVGLLGHQPFIPSLWRPRELALRGIHADVVQVYSQERDVLLDGTWGHLIPGLVRSFLFLALLQGFEKEESFLSGFLSKS